MFVLQMYINIFSETTIKLENEAIHNKLLHVEASNAYFVINRNFNITFSYIYTKLMLYKFIFITPSPIYDILPTKRKIFRKHNSAVTDTARTYPSKL